MSLKSDRLETIDLLLEKYRTPAIMLNTPCPPFDARRLRSRFGGLPLLPEEVAWPSWGQDENETEIPLHFLAQIDCSELPRLDSRMPSEGFLFFFCKNDHEMAWGGHQHSYSRVIYVSHIPENQPERQHPPELPQLRAGYDGKLDYLGHSDEGNPYWMLPEEIGPSVYPSWPIEALCIDSWPALSAIEGSAYYKEVTANLDLSSQDEDGKSFDDLYSSRMVPLMGKSNISALGLTGGYYSSSNMAWQNETFPQAGVMVDRIARLTALTAMKGIKSMQRIAALIRDGAKKYRAPLPEDEEKLQRLILDARRWIARAKEIGWEETPSDAARQEFRGWLSEMETYDSILKVPRNGIVNKGIDSCSTVAGGSPRVAALMMPQYFKTFLRTSDEKVSPYNWVRPCGHQMLGYFPHWTHEEWAESPTVRLFYVCQDHSLGHWDGYISFFIEPDDLINRRFEKADASIDNGWV